MSVITSGKFSDYFFKYLFCPILFSLLVFQLQICYTFWYLPTVSGCCFFKIYFSLYILVWEVSIDLFSSSLILSLAMLSIQMSPLKACFIFLTVVFISSFSSWFFFYSFHVSDDLVFWLCMFSIFCTRIFIILVIVILIFLSGNFNICVISESGSVNCAVSWQCVMWVLFVCLFSSMSCNFFLKATHSV